MGSVTSHIECPRCKQDHCTDEYWYKTGEQWIYCPDCGYNYTSFYKRDDNGELAMKDESKGHEFDNLIMETSETDNPYCAYRIVSVTGLGEGGVILNEIDYHNFVSDIESLKDQLSEIDLVTISKFTDNGIVKEVLYQKQSNDE